MSQPPCEIEEPVHPVRRWLGSLMRVIGIACAVGLGTALVLLVLLPRLMGWVPLTVLSGSMEPAIPIGSQVVVERVQTEAELADIEIGDVISFMPQPNDRTVVTHRVVAQSVQLDGDIMLTTRGDANEVNDPELIGVHQIRGVSKYHIPYAGYVASFLDVRQKQTGTVIVAVLLLSYAGWNLLAALRERRKAQPESNLVALEDISDEEQASR